ncbi:hypothetical protein D3C73_1050320 [compost metagenome]
MLFAAGLFETAGEVVDVLRQCPQLGVIDNRQRCFVIAGLDRLDGIADITDRLRQAARQASGHEEGKQQGKQRQNGSLEHDFLLAPAEGIVGQPDDHPAEVVLGGGGSGGFAALEKVIVQSDSLEPYGCLEHFELLRAIVVFVRLFDIHQNPVGAVLDFQKAHVGRGQRRLEQGFKHFAVARNHPVLGGGGQLVGDQLAGVGDFLTQILDTHEGEEADQQQGQQQGRAEADELGAGVDVPATAQVHGRRSPSASNVATDASFISSIPRERATWGLLATLNRWG